MKIEVNIEKKYVFLFVGIIVLLLSIIGVYASWNETKSFWHSGNDVKVQVSGQNYSLQEAITSGLIGAGSASATPISTFNGQGRVSYNYAPPSGNVGWYTCNSGYVVSAIHQSYNGVSYFTDYITCSPVPYMA